MGFGNFINNKSQLLIIIQSTVQKEFFLLHLLLLSLVFVFVFVFMLEMFINSLIPTERHFQRSFVLDKMWNGSQEIVFFSSIDISVPFSILFDQIDQNEFMLLAQLSMESLCLIFSDNFLWMTFYELNFFRLLFVISDEVAWFLPVHVILSGSFTGRQIDIFAIGLFDSDFTTKSRIIGFVPPIETIVRVATDWIEEIKAKQINARFFYCIYFEKWMDYSSAFCTFAAADFFVVQTFLFVEMTDCIFERKILNVWGALNWKHANAPCQ